jgi:hypothetical protein
MPALRVLTWHIHGSYLYYLSQTPVEFYLPVKPDRANGYGGRGGNSALPANVHEVPAEEVRRIELDCILFQSKQNYLQDQYEILSASQRSLPRLYLEHDPPREHPTDTRHPVDDPNILLVHCTAFNRLMWDNGRTPTRVIEHGVIVPPEARYSGEIDRGLTVINNLKSRGRRLGADIFEQTQRQVPLDLVGINATEMLGGLGEVPLPQLPAFMARYRFFFNPIRYTSLGLAVCEAMMVGLPIIGLATTEMVKVVENGVAGYLDTEPENLVECMRTLINSPALGHQLSEGARRTARQLFHIDRFAQDWLEAFRLATGNRRKLWVVPDQPVERAG